VSLRIAFPGHVVCLFAAEVEREEEAAGGVRVFGWEGVGGMVM
jgi:hypothetical protein